MGWRDSYAKLVEVFPQVDTRLIKGAALEHDDDIDAAVEFIMNEVLGADEDISGNGHRPEITLFGSKIPFRHPEQGSTLAGEEHAVSATDCGTSSGDFKQYEHEADWSSTPQSLSVAFPLSAEKESRELNEEFQDDMDRNDFFKEDEENPETQVDLGGSVVSGLESEFLKLIRREPAEENECGDGNLQGNFEPSGEGLESDLYGSALDLEDLKDTQEAEEVEDFTLTFAGNREDFKEKDLIESEFPENDGSIGSQRSSPDEGEEEALDEGLDSIPKSAISEEMDKTDWENVNDSAIIHSNQMELLDSLVDVAKADKEALISTIEDVRLLRFMTDHAESDARRSREEAARGGGDVMAKVEEMRKMLSRAHETNAVHAGEVFGEKAVLATEARELQYRLAQVNREHAEAVAALNEIKASLLERLENAVREKKAADQDKVTNEVLAKEALAKEEELVAKVAQESRDLEAEDESCAKIRDFLTERGSLVDALQGEVAVLREDAEALKKDLEGMSISYISTGFPTRVLSPAGSEIYNSIASRAEQLSELCKEASDKLVQVEDGASSGRADSVFEETPSVHSDKKWSALPSMLSGLPGSQDLDGSAHSSVASCGDELIFNKGENSQVRSLENDATDMKYSLSPDSPASASGAQEERNLLKAKMAMFPGEELGMEYSGIHNLDVFRTEKPSSDEDWEYLERGSSKSSSRSSTGK